MCEVIVVDAGRSRSTWFGCDAYIMIIALDSVIIICFSINCSTVICLPTVCYFLERDATSESYGPRVYFYYKIYLVYLYKNTKNTCCTFLSFIYLSIYHIPFNLVTWPPRDWQPLICVGCEGLGFVCRCCLRGVAWFSYWIDNLGFLTEGNTYSTVLHHPLLFGDKNPTQSTISRPSVC